jgi:hypothetical protein
MGLRQYRRCMKPSSFVGRVVRSDRLAVWARVTS